MTWLEEFVEPNNDNHWNMPPLSGIIYHDVLAPKILTGLKKELENITTKSTTATFFTNASIFTYNGKKYRLGTNVFNDRYQNVIYDFSYHPEYWYQTKDTIYDWIQNLIIKNCSPHFIKYFHTINNLKPFNSKEYVPYRLHINNSPYLKHLGLHLDGMYMLVKGDYFSARMFSVTQYLYDHIEDKGGEFFSINGFVYKPKANEALLINGHQVMHGVNENLNHNTRLAFTSRWAHVDDLFLPGHPDKHLWNVNIDV